MVWTSSRSGDGVCCPEKGGQTLKSQLYIFHLNILCLISRHQMCGVLPPYDSRGQPLVQLRWRGSPRRIPHKSQPPGGSPWQQVPWLASTATFRPPLNSGSMALGSTTCQGQRHGVGARGERGTERRGERMGSTGGSGNGQRTKKGRRGDKQGGEEKRQPLVGSAKEYWGFYEGGIAN